MIRIEDITPDRTLIYTAKFSIQGSVLHYWPVYFGIAQIGWKSYTPDFLNFWTDEIPF